MSNDDLSGNGNNPYSNGAPGPDVTTADGKYATSTPMSTGYGFTEKDANGVAIARVPYWNGIPGQEVLNPGAGNPFSNGAPGLEDISAGLDRIVRDVATNRQPTKAPQPTAADYNRDKGLGSDGNGRS